MTPRTRRTIVIIATVVAVVAFVCSFVRQALEANFHIERTAYVLIDTNDNLDSVLAKVDAAARPTTLLGLRMMAAVTSYADHLHTGRYAVEPGGTMLDLFRHLHGGTQSPVQLTVVPVRTIAQMAAQLADELMVDSARLAQALADTTVIAPLGYNRETVLSLFIPNTYEVYWDTDVTGLLSRLSAENARFWTTERTESAARLGLTKAEVYTLASIIDSETANDAEKPVIAGLYLNRLRIGMPLQSDPTVIFAIGDYSIHRVRHEHLTYPSPYNTYLHRGMPPGPIRVASIAGIDAVLHADHNDYLYMCAKDDLSGTHEFATTFAEHTANARHYAAALNRRGITQ